MSRGHVKTIQFYQEESADLASSIRQLNEIYLRAAERILHQEELELYERKQAVEAALKRVEQQSRGFGHIK